MQHLLFLCKKIKLQNPAGFNVCSERFGAKHSYETEPSSKFPSGVNLSTTTASFKFPTFQWTTLKYRSSRGCKVLVFQVVSSSPPPLYLSNMATTKGSWSSWLRAVTTLSSSVAWERLRSLSWEPWKWVAVMTIQREEHDNDGDNRSGDDDSPGVSR